MNLSGFGVEHISISCTILITNSFNLLSSRCYGYRQPVIYVAAILDVTYASWITEIPDSDNVRMNYRKTISYRVSLEIGAGHQGFPVPCSQRSLFGCCSNGETKRCLSTPHKSKAMMTQTFEEKP